MHWRTLYCRLSALLALLLIALHPGAYCQNATTIRVTVHADAPMGAFTPIWSYFGADEPNYVYGPHGRKLMDELGELGRTANAPVYFRAHNLLTTGDGGGSLKWGSTNAYTERADGTGVYDWTITDRIFDAMRDAHVRPIVELGFMPEALSTHPTPYRHNFPKGDVFTGWSYPPKDYAKWGALVQAYAAHLKTRYGTAVDGWLWEVWNEPDIAYWHGTPEEYDRLYDVSAAAVRKVLPDARIGGPESTGVYPAKNGVSTSEAFLRQFLEHCAHGKNAATGGIGAPLDFISYHPKGSPKFVNGHVVMDVGRQLAAVERGMEVVASFPEWRNTAIVLGESDPEGCAACQSAQNGYRNGPLYGVSVAEATARTWELARNHGVHVQSAVTWAFTFEGQPYFAGFRELATNGVDKAVLNVFRMMAMLGGQWVRTESTGAMPVGQIVTESVTETASVTETSDVDAIATRRPHEVDVLLWNYHDADVPAASEKIALEVRGLPQAQISEEAYLMDASHSNAYAVWKQMGGPQTPTAMQQQELVKAGKLERVVAAHPVAVKGGMAHLQMTVARQGVTLVRLRWE